MAEEKEAEVQEPQTPEEPQVSEEPKADELQSQIAKLQSELEAVKGDAAAQQRSRTKAEQELAKRQETDSKIESMETRLEVLTEMLAEVVDRGTYEQTETTKRPSQEYLSRLDSTRKAKEKQDAEARQEEFTRKAMEADRLAKGVGLDMGTSPELKTALYMFRAGETDEGLEEVKRVVDSKMPKTEKEPKIDLEAIKEELEREFMEKHGLLNTDTGEPSGGGSEGTYTMGQVEKMSPEEFDKAFPQGIGIAIKQGKILH